MTPKPGLGVESARRVASSTLVVMLVFAFALIFAMAVRAEDDPPAENAASAPEAAEGEPDAISDEAPQPEAEPKEENEEKKRSSRDKLEDLWEDYQPYAFNFYPYKPMYFGVATHPKESKYQVSFRYQFMKSDGKLAEDHPWVTGFNLAYTQTSFWDLKSDSEPFSDTSYRPEVFFRSPFILLGPKWAKGFLAQGGYRHESNGRGGDASRSTNHLYVELNWIFDLGKDYAILVTPEAFAYVGNDNDTNPDLDEYRGYFELELMFADKDGFAIATHYMHGTKGWSVSTDFTYPLNRLFNENFEIYFMAQRFDGYSESLIDFKKKTHATRIGIALIR